MKNLLIALALAALSACAGGVNTAEVQCPSDRSQGLNHQQWEACYGRQDHDEK